MALLGRVNKLAKLFRTRGIRGAGRLLDHQRHARREARSYRRWLEMNRIDAQRRKELRSAIKRFDSRPLISIILPVYNIEERWLRRCIDSVLGQLYVNWELCIADDRSTMEQIRPLIDEYLARDERIKAVFRPENGHISAASNSALELVNGEFVVLLDHDDELPEDALFWVAAEIGDHPDAAMIYSDEDKIDGSVRRHSPSFKPDWSRDLFYSLNLFNHLSVYRTAIVRRVGGFRIGFEGSQDYDLALRFIEQIGDSQIRHIPRILYHWRAIEGSVALSGGEKPYAHERARRAIREHFDRTGIKATVEATVHDLHRVRYTLPEAVPKVSLVVFLQNGDAQVAGREILAGTELENLELIPVSDGGSMSAALNSAVERSNGDVVCFVDGRLRPLSPDWLRELVSFAMQEKIGAAGAKLLNRDRTIWQSGVLIGVNGMADSAHRGMTRDDAGYFFRAGVINNYSAVSSACMAIRRDVLDEIGGFDAQNLPDLLYDIDLCLRLGEKGYRAVFTPYAELAFGDRTERSNLNPANGSKECEYFAERWKAVIERDPYYNPNLTRHGLPFSIKV